MIFTGLYLEKYKTQRKVRGVVGKLTVFWFTDTMDINALNVTMTEEIKRGDVLADLHAGRSPRVIAEFNKLSLSFV